MCVVVFSLDCSVYSKSSFFPIPVIPEGRKLGADEGRGSFIYYFIHFPFPLESSFSQ